jgi:hypothetical protein
MATDTDVIWDILFKKDLEIVEKLEKGIPDPDERLKYIIEHGLYIQMDGEAETVELKQGLKPFALIV